LLGNLATVSSGRADSYETDLDFWPKNPKANLLRNRAVVSYGRSESYETNLDFWPKIPKANLLRNRAIVSYGKTKSYENAPSFLAQFSQSQFWHTASSCKGKVYKYESPFLA